MRGLAQLLADNARFVGLADAQQVEETASSYERQPVELEVSEGQRDGLSVWTLTNREPLRWREWSEDGKPIAYWLLFDGDGELLYSHRVRRERKPMRDDSVSFQAGNLRLILGDL